MSKSKELADAHWDYIEMLLEQSILVEDNMIDTKTLIEMIGFHYKTSFIHGFKHGQEELK